VEREKDKREEIEKKVEKGGLGARPCINIYVYKVRCPAVMGGTLS
jgi:hypothetical protein